jgi:magnesium chelatase accessory protein
MAAQPGAVARWIERTGSTLDAPGLALYASVLKNSGHVHSVLSMMAAWSLKPLAARLSDLRNPVFMAIADKDQTVPPALADDACLCMPHAQKIIQHGLGHLAHEEDPVGTAQLIVRLSTSS